MVASVNSCLTPPIKRMMFMKLTVHKEKRKAQYFTEALGNRVALDMVLIPSGTFLMSSPQDELERDESESPQHQVTMPSFSMGKYPVTQAQWKAVAAMSEVNSALDLSPSDFKGNAVIRSVHYLLAGCSTG